MIPQRVSLVTIGALDLPKLRTFYQKLGWEETAESSDNYAVFKTAGVMLTLFPFQQLAEDAGISGQSLQKKDFSGITLAINVNEKEDVDKFVEIIRNAGGKIVREPSDAFWGGRTSYFTDPENNYWELAWNPASVFDNRGAMIQF